MAQPISHLQYKIFNMKLYLILLSFLIVGFVDAQILPQSLIANNNAYPINTSGADVAFNLESAISTVIATTYPAIKSNFSFNFSNTTPYTFQFLVNKVVSNNTRFGFIGFTTATNGFSYDPASFLFYQFDNGVIRNYVKNEYLGGNVNVNSFVIGQTYQITTTYNGSQWKHYVNGILFSIVTNKSTWSGTGNLMLGNIGGYTNVFLDEVRFWDRALTQDEISNNYKNPLIGNENGLKLYYSFNNQGNPSENNSNIEYVDLLMSISKGIEAPVELRYFSDPAHPGKSWKAAAGFKLGTLLKSYTKGKNMVSSSGTSINGKTFIQKEQNKRFFNSTDIALTARGGYGIFSVDVGYQVNGVLRDSFGPVMNKFSVGFTFSGL